MRICVMDKESVKEGKKIGALHQTDQLTETVNEEHLLVWESFSPHSSISVSFCVDKKGLQEITKKKEVHENRKQEPSKKVKVENV